ncbi:hypothetical protein BKP45_00970 [Anaerobacillus alkalidiazotrophicus]|uniref:ATP-grasp domain-containing protein n=1 Tax=Anaerobacillus alkalidiazotrophicus TaxID=472963 RepID=A0A1S2M9B7_9BACI|nr:YheC/YheD family protein [Anaerobacillus alkalidiazotrophicus]OIJ21382.1 hypothetical protein BKP45_00970 [Anaerobacillus alkalidiazotrophicus]
MFNRKIIVQATENGSLQKSDQIKISQSLCKKWAIRDGEQVSIKFGNHLEKVYVNETPSLKTPTIVITFALKEKLSIPFEILPIHCLYNSNENTLKLGPILTCITNQMYHEQTQFGTITTFFEEMARFAKNHHIFFYIKPLINWDGSFFGYTFEQDKWQEYLLPYPDAVYNRIGSRGFEASKVYQEFSSHLRENGINYFNHSFLNKWEINQALSSFPEVQPYLPDTTLFGDYDTFAEKLTIYNCIFVKPVNGSQGRQILKIENNDHEYSVYYSSFTQEISTKFQSSYILYQRLKERLKKKTFIVQQGIDLIHIQGRPLDFRVLCVKGGENEWKVISSVARISPKEKMVSNLAQGGEQKRPLDVLTDLFDEKLAQQYVKLMSELAIEVAYLISESYEGLFGELGIDIALDTEGKLWIIEVNSKPSKSEIEIGTERIRPSTRAIINYLAFLSGFPIQNNRRGKKER